MCHRSDSGHRRKHRYSCLQNKRLDQSHSIAQQRGRCHLLICRHELLASVMTQLSQHSLLWWWRLYRFWSMLPEDTGSSTYMWPIGAQNTTMSLGTHLLSLAFCFCLTSLFAPGTPGGTGPRTQTFADNWRKCFTGSCPCRQTNSFKAL